MHSHRKSKVTPELSRKYNTEKILARNLLEDFTASGSRGEALIEQILHQEIRKASRTGLIQLGSIVGELIGKKFPRNYTRKRDLIVKWFEDNEVLIRPFVSHLRVEFCDLDEEQNKSDADETDSEQPAPSS